jgi:protein phosphatase
MKIEIPDFAVVALIGVSGSGKSSFAAEQFLPTEVLSSDVYRGLVSDDENDQSATPAAFDALHHVAGLRLQARRLCVLDATHTTKEARKPAVQLAKRYHALPVAIVLDMPTKLCLARNETRADRSFGKHVIPNQASQLRRSLRGLKREGFRRVYVLRSPEELESVTLQRVPLWTDKRDQTGPFDIIGDVHGCYDELRALVSQLGYTVHEREAAQNVAPDETATEENAPRYRAEHPEGRKLVFVGDLVDRGPGVDRVLEFVMDLIEQGSAHCILGNHEAKLLRKLNGRDVQIRHGLQESLDQLEARGQAFAQRTRSFLDSLVSHYVLDDGRLVVAHAGLKAELQGRASGVVRSFALYGDTTGEVDEFGLPVRHDWAQEYRGDAMVVYGHTPTPEAEWLNRTICIDTGCVFGGKLTALRYPEQELISVPAAQVYCEPVRPLESDEVSPVGAAQQEHDRLLHYVDVAGKRILSTRLRPNLTVPGEHSAAALELMSRFALDPRLLIYLPPTMAPSETSDEAGFLEHPREALAYFARQRIQRVVCEQKHMGSRCVVLVTQDDSVLGTRFGIERDAAGACYTRTGRSFFDDPQMDREFLDRVRAAVTEAELWSRVESNWLLLDCELMPWSAKAQALLREQYAPSGAAATAGLAAAEHALARASQRGIDVAELQGGIEREAEAVRRYIDAYRRYCWPVDFARTTTSSRPFHLLASEGHVHVDKRPRLAHGDPRAGSRRSIRGFFLATPFQLHAARAAEDDLQDRARTGGSSSPSRAARAWSSSPGASSPAASASYAQPALKCRGREYLRIIYGPDYLREEHLQPAPQARAAAPSARWLCVSLRSAWRRSSASCAGSPYAGCTSASLGSWPSRASRWTPGSEKEGTEPLLSINLCAGLWPRPEFRDVRQAQEALFGLPDLPARIRLERPGARNKQCRSRGAPSARSASRNRRPRLASPRADRSSHAARAAPGAVFLAARRTRAPRHDCGGRARGDEARPRPASRRRPAQALFTAL